MQRWLLVASISTAVFAPVSAQNTWIVDPSGGGAFTDLQTAIDTVAPGDTLLLRGNLAAATLDKRMLLVGDPAASIAALDIASPGGPVTLAGFHVAALNVQNGIVGLEAIAANSVAASASTLTCSRCTASSFSFGVTGEPAWKLSNGTVAAFDSCLFRGADGAVVAGRCIYRDPTPGLYTTSGSSAWLANCIVIGGNGLAGSGCNIIGAAAILADAGTSVATARCFVRAGDGNPSAQPAQGSGSFSDDGSNYVGGFAGATPIVLPETRSIGGPPGGAITCIVRGTPGLPAVLVASLGIRQPGVQAGLQGPVWIDPNAYVVLVLGLLDGAGELGTSIPIPPVVRRGIPLAIQGAVQPAASPDLVVAVPTVAHVR